MTDERSAKKAGTRSVSEDRFRVATPTVKWTTCEGRRGHELSVREWSEERKGDRRFAAYEEVRVDRSLQANRHVRHPAPRARPSPLNLPDQEHQQHSLHHRHHGRVARRLLPQPVAAQPGALPLEDEPAVFRVERVLHPRRWRGCERGAAGPEEGAVVLKVHIGRVVAREWRKLAKEGEDARRDVGRAELARARLSPGEVGPLGRKPAVSVLLNLVAVLLNPAVNLGHYHPPHRADLGPGLGGA